MNTQYVAFDLAPAHVHAVLSWMRESGMPFRVKLSHMLVWTGSRTGVKFFARFGKQADTAECKALPKFKVNLIILKRDRDLVNWSVRMHDPRSKVRRMRNK